MDDDTTRGSEDDDVVNAFNELDRTAMLRAAKQFGLGTLLFALAFHECIIAELIKWISKR